MCLAVPARVLALKDEIAEVEQLGKIKKVSAKFVKPKIGDYVLVQGKFVTAIMDKKDVKESLKLFKK